MRGCPAARDVDAERHAVGQVLVNGLVASHAGGIHPLQLEDHPLGLLLRHPLVEPQQGAPEPCPQQHLTLIAALRRQRFPRDVRPAQLLQQLPRRVLGVMELVEPGGSGHGLSPRESSNIFRSCGSRFGIAS